MQVKFGVVLDPPHKSDLETCHFEQIQVVKLFLHCVSHLRFHLLMFDEYFSNRFSLFVQYI